MTIPKIQSGTAMFQFAVFEAILPGTDVPLYLFSHPSFPAASTLGKMKTGGLPCLPMGS